MSKTLRHVGVTGGKTTSTLNLLQKLDGMSNHKESKILEQPKPHKSLGTKLNEMTDGMVAAVEGRTTESVRNERLSSQERMNMAEELSAGIVPSHDAVSFEK